MSGNPKDKQTLYRQKAEAGNCFGLCVTQLSESGVNAMDKTEGQQNSRTPDPFDGSARERFAHMGLVGNNGNLRIKHMLIFTNIFTGAFYDDLLDFHGDAGGVLAVFEAFKALYKKEDYQHMYLLMSVQYDYMRKPLPDPVWWLAGEGEAVSAFMVMFMPQFERLLISGGYYKPEGVEP